MREETLGKVKGERKLVDTLLGSGPIHRTVKLSTLVIPSIVGAICDLKAQTGFFIPAFIAGFLAMMGMIYYNINRARESD